MLGERGLDNNLAAYGKGLEAKAHRCVPTLLDGGEVNSACFFAGNAGSFTAALLLFAGCLLSAPSLSPMATAGKQHYVGKVMMQ